MPEFADRPVIIGAGPAGLAVAACLVQAGHTPLVLEQGPAVGTSWRHHYARLHLHTPKGGSSLPGLPFPDDVPRYPSRQQVVDYLERYQRHFGIRVLFDHQVVCARPAGDLWEVRTDRETWRVPTLVVASGYNREPHRPTWPGQEAYRGGVLHSSAYLDGREFRGLRVLVVGLGNSGGEIAVDLCEHGADTHLAVRGPVNIVPRDVLGIPAQRFTIAQRHWPPAVADAFNRAIVRLVTPDLEPYGLLRPDAGPLTQIAERRRIPLIDIGTVNLIRQGLIAVHPGIDHFANDGVVFTDGVFQSYDAVVLATGYRPCVDGFLSGVDGMCDANGTPLVSGAVTPWPGLYFCGFSITATGMLREIGLEARRIAESIGPPHPGRRAAGDGL